VVGRFQDVIARGLLGILEQEAALRVLGSGLDHGALERAVARGRAQVVLLDEDNVAEPAVLKRLHGARAGVGVVVLAHRPSRAYVMRVLACGVSVCLSLDASAQEIVGAVHLAAAGARQQVLVATSSRPSHRGRSQGGRATGGYVLTRRERQVLELLGKGRKNVEIARTLEISTETARTHAKHVYRKLGVNSRSELLGVEL
jgi:DNA-binding NarL/FixJ family response regulator